MNFKLRPSASRYSSCLGSEKASFEIELFYESETMTYQQLCKTSHDENKISLSSFLESLVNLIQHQDEEGEAFFSACSPSNNYGE